MRASLIGVLKRYKIKSMLDSSCGSMLWMPLVLREIAKDVPSFRFYGSDVVCNLIEKHKVTFANESNWSFGCNDYGEVLRSGLVKDLGGVGLGHLLAKGWGKTTGKLTALGRFLGAQPKRRALRCRVENTQPQIAPYAALFARALTPTPSSLLAPTLRCHSQPAAALGL